MLFLSRLSRAKGVDDLISGFERTHCRRHVKLVIAGNGPESVALRAQASLSPAADQIVFLDDVDDAEKTGLMAGCSAFALPSKPRPEFVETFGIALVEKMLAGGGPVITCRTGGIPEAVGPHALLVPHGSPQGIAEALDHDRRRHVDCRAAAASHRGPSLCHAVRPHQRVRPALRGHPPHRRRLSGDQIVMTMLPT